MYFQTTPGGVLVMSDYWRVVSWAIFIECNFDIAGGSMMKNVPGQRESKQLMFTWMETQHFPPFALLSFIKFNFKDVYSVNI